MVPYGFRFKNTTVPYNTTTSYKMATLNFSLKVNNAVSEAAGILASATPNSIVPVESATIPPSTGNTLAPPESAVTLSPSYTFPDPDVLVVTTFSTTTIPYLDPVIQVPTLSPVEPTTKHVTPIPSSTSVLFGFPVVPAAPSSTINIIPSSTILPNISPTSLTTTPTLTPSYIIPTTLETLSSTPSPQSTQAPASLTSTTPLPTNSNSSTSHLGAYIGGAVGGAAITILFLLAIFCLARRRKSKSPKHHPDRPAFIGGYELKLDKVGDLQRVVHEKIVRRNTFEAWKKGVVPSLKQDADDMAGKSEISLGVGTPQTGYSGPLADVAESVSSRGLSDQEGRESFRGEKRSEAGDDEDRYMVSPIEEEQNPSRPVSGINPLIFEWEERVDQRGDSTIGIIGLAI
ncbi:uncharacterized protein EAF01_004075 [Botrytis porri]|uniref:Mid2 domain-containing protein n=1 Tax=Botrytis porri TaxID=87229 RepID=A0A4Z1L199_9HELO|nr:uncharacterized protein EAF01_004075 [Botrytis porri]KAF7908320.1 hypothetical protein EAF01_004075 [Botrytis porri]TGO90612.1 hypothetical protein BPOR_0057g00090 [Botrytis porri]